MGASRRPQNVMIVYCTRRIEVTDIAGVLEYP